MKVELHSPTKQLRPRNVKNLAAWSERMAKELEPGTIMVVRKAAGTVQYRLQEARYWKFLRETYGP